jgi:Tol biopolymer transport system component
MGLELERPPWKFIKPKMKIKKLLLNRIFVLAFVFICLTLVGRGQEKAAHYYNPNWSPDGKRIVFESDRDGKSAIYTIRKDGSELKKLTGDESNNVQPRWSRNGRQIVFISNRSGKSQVYVMNFDGSNERRITNDSENNYAPDLSLKANKLVFVSRDIFTIGLDGANKTRLTDSSGDYESPRWSPDGKFILFVKTDFIPKDVEEKLPKMSREERRKVLTEKDKSNEIFVMKADGSDVKNLTNNNFWDFEAEWSKDGRTIYFLSKREGDTAHVYAMNSDGSNVRRVADGAVVKGTSVSPDERFLAYTKEVDKKHGLYVYDIKSGKERVLIAE